MTVLPVNNGLSHVSLHCLHGFFGAPKDWDGIFPKSDRTSLLDGPIGEGLSAYGKWVTERARSTGASDRRILVGYSLGGRIALQSLLGSSDVWSAAVIISANPGLVSDTERELRRSSDAQWASRIAEDPDWDQVIRDWNSQSVFSGIDTRAVVADDLRGSRKRWAEIMESCSLGRQEDLRAKLKNISIPILWISGEYDAKYCAIAQEMAALSGQIRAVTLKGAAHRAPWDRTQDFIRVVMEFLSEIQNEIQKGT